MRLKREVFPPGRVRETDGFHGLNPCVQSFSDFLYSSVIFVISSIHVTSISPSSVLASRMKDSLVHSMDASFVLLQT